MPPTKPINDSSRGSLFGWQMAPHCRYEWRQVVRAVRRALQSSFAPSGSERLVLYVTPTDNGCTHRAPLKVHNDPRSHAHQPLKSTVQISLTLGLSGHCSI